MTAETMMGLIVGARSRLRIFSPFLDARALDVLAVALSAATRRGVQTAFGYARRGNRDNAIEQLEQHVRANGDSSRLQTVAIEGDRPFPHLKLIAADGERAYIGSANLTWPALTSNAEIGALVEANPSAFSNDGSTPWSQPPLSTSQHRVERSARLSELWRRSAIPSTRRAANTD